MTDRKTDSIDSMVRHKAAVRNSTQCRGVRWGWTLVFLAAAAWFTLRPAGVEAVEFVTRQSYLSESTPYREYPYRLLFQKFNESEGEEKRALRNTILLRQVFEATPP
ncbi:MAG: hypothetical protein LJE65_06055, partial [Desulfobacteraceae bacterium]|nr:hypothetical protein [Desulfobacteraceae bacterium]